MVSSPDFSTFSIHEKTATPARHKPVAHPTSAPSADSRKKRPRSHGGRRNDLQEEVRMLLQEDLHAMDVVEDQDMASPSPAASRASNMLSQDSWTSCTKEVQPAATLSRRESNRLPVQKDAGKKRTCCSTAAFTLPPAETPVHVSGSRLFGEMI